MEPVRPQIDTFVLDWITREPLRRESCSEWTTQCFHRSTRIAPDPAVFCGLPLMLQA